MKIKCHDCVYYDELDQDCIKDQYDGCGLLADKCTIFKERKKCNNRYEDCSGMCDIICHKFPSDAGCKFIYKCKLDDYACDEKCENHQLRHNLKEKQEELSKLYDTQKFIEKLIEKNKIEIEELNNKRNEL